MNPVLSLILVISISCFLPMIVGDDDLIHCSPTHQLLLSKLALGIQQNCTVELPDAHKKYCNVYCMIKKMNVLGDDGKPDKTKFDSMVDMTFHADLRTKVKGLKCFDYASKIEKSDDISKVCTSAKEFDDCFQDMSAHLCDVPK